MPARCPKELEQAALDHLVKNSVYRGQWGGERTLRSDLPSFAFGSREAAGIYANEPNDRTLAGDTPNIQPVIHEASLQVSKVYCRTNLEDSDPFFDLDELGEDFGRDIVTFLAEIHADNIEDTQSFLDLQEETGRSLEEMVDAWPLRQERLPCIEAHVALREPGMIEALQKAGYDAVAIGGSGQNAMEMEFHIFDADLAINPVTGAPFGAWQAPEDPDELIDLCM